MGERYYSGEFTADPERTDVRVKKEEVLHNTNESSDLSSRCEQAYEEMTGSTDMPPKLKTALINHLNELIEQNKGSKELVDDLVGSEITRYIKMYAK